MNLPLPSRLLSKIWTFLGRFKPHPLVVARKQILLASLGAGLGLSLTSFFSHWLLGEINPWFIAPIGAASVLVFALPNSPLTQPWSIIGGNFISALAGVTVGLWIDNVFVASGVAVALAILLMFQLRCLHPPGGAVALTAIMGGSSIHSEGYEFAFTPVLINSVSLAVLAIIFNNLVGRRYPHPLAATEPPPPPVKISVAITRDDLRDALLAGQFLDIDEDDLQEVLLHAEQIAQQRVSSRK